MRNPLISNLTDGTRTEFDALKPAQKGGLRTIALTPFSIIKWFSIHQGYKPFRINISQILY